MSEEMTIPLFPLGVVLMPHTPLPLHIFEERYKIMIGECLSENKEFGVVYFDGGKIGKVGCTARIVEILKQFDNGEMDILTNGTHRFVIREMRDAKPYLEADVTLFDDLPETESEDLVALANQGLEALRALNRMTGEIENSDTPQDLNVKIISFLISGNQGFTPAEKQKLLEMTSTRNRLESSVKSLQKVLQRERLTREIQNIITGNGNIKKILREYPAD